MKAMLCCRIVGALGLSLAALAASAQSRPLTTEQLGKDPGALRQEAEQQRAQERAQQQQSSQQQADQQWNDTVRRNQARAANDAAQGEAVRRSWAQRPPLAPEHNALLGRWESLGAGQRGNAAGLPPELAKMAAELIGGITSGLCDSMLGRGTVEFRPAGVFAIGRDGRERAMYRAEYRGEGSRVVVLPQGGTTFTHMIIDFSGRDRATVAAVGCALTRSGGGASAVSMANPSPPAGPSGGPVEEWKLLGTSAANGGMDVYVARSTIRRSGASAQMSDLFDFKTPQRFERRTFFSARNRYEYDCSHARRRMLSTTGFSGHMGQGAVVASDASVGAWEPVGSGNVIHDYWKVACAKE
ncbi:MAG TPA: surface-adhesin E family protein [Caldimonas sp.]|nr:surface-adhesin E family protein [Caldimonas sp.]